MYNSTAALWRKTAALQQVNDPLLRKTLFSQWLGTIKHKVVTVNACNNGIPVRLSCHCGDMLEKTKTDKDRGRACTRVHVCLCVSDPSWGKGIANELQVAVGGKQTNKHQQQLLHHTKLVTRTSGCLRCVHTLKHINPHILQNAWWHEGVQSRVEEMEIREGD